MDYTAFFRKQNTFKVNYTAQSNFLVTEKKISFYKNAFLDLSIFNTFITKGFVQISSYIFDWYDISIYLN